MAASDVARRSPAIYETHLSATAMLAAQRPFVIGVAQLQPQIALPLHWHDAYEIGFVVEGTGIFVVDDAEIAYAPGQVHVINRNARHMAYAATPSRFFNVHFHPDLAHSTPFQAIGGVSRPIFAATFAPLLPAEASSTRAIITHLQAIAAEHEQRQIGWQVIVQGHLLQIIGTLLRSALTDIAYDPTKERRAHNAHRLAPVLSALAAEAYPPPTLAELAALVDLSPAHLSSLFRQTFGVAPIAYRNLLRMQQARRWLVETTWPIAIISERCGFLSTQQFHRLFVRATGLTPRAYRAHTLATE